MKLSKLFVGLIFIQSSAFINFNFAQITTIEFETITGQHWGICEFDFFEIADSATSITTVYEGEYPTSATVGQLIHRSNASNKRDWGQFGCTPNSYIAIPGNVVYEIEDLTPGTKYLRIRYSKHSPSTVPVIVKVNGEVITSFVPVNQGSWESFTYSHWIQFEVEAPAPPPCMTPENVELEPISSSSVFISWDAVPNATTYMLKYFNSTLEEYVGELVSDEAQITVEGLNEDHKYAFLLSGFCCTDGWSGWADTIAYIYETEEQISRPTSAKINDELRGTKIQVSPNPAGNSLIVKLNALDGQTLQILDYSGAILNTQIIAGNQSVEVNTSRLVPGQYFVLVKDHFGNITTAPFIKIQ